MSPTDACTNMTSTFGVASRRSVVRMGPSSSTRVRVSKWGVVADGVPTSRRDSLRTRGATLAPRASASMPLLPAKRHARRRRPRHEALLLVGDVALDEPQSFPAFDDPPGRPELGRPHGLEEVDLQLKGREGLPLHQRA